MPNKIGTPTSTCRLRYKFLPRISSCWHVLAFAYAKYAVTVRELAWANLCTRFDNFHYPTPLNFGVPLIILKLKSVNKKKYLYGIRNTKLFPGYIEK